MVIVAIAVLAAAVSFSAAEGQAYLRYEGPWCAVQSIGAGVVTEELQHAELRAVLQRSDRRHRGFCSPNRRWQGSVLEQPRRQLRLR